MSEGFSISRDIVLCSFSRIFHVIGAGRSSNPTSISPIAALNIAAIIWKGKSVIQNRIIPPLNVALAKIERWLDNVVPDPEGILR